MLLKAATANRWLWTEVTTSSMFVIQLLSVGGGGELFTETSASSTSERAMRGGI